MAIKIYNIINTETMEAVKTIQVKRRDMAEKCIDEYIRIGAIPDGEYSVELANIEK